MSPANLPEVLSQAPPPSPTRHRRTSSTRYRPPSHSLGPRFAALQSDTPPPAPSTPNAPAIIRGPSQVSYVGKPTGPWAHGRATYRSPLAIASSHEPAEDVETRSFYYEYWTRGRRPPSRRFLKPPFGAPTGRPQDFRLDSLGTGAGAKQEAFFEEMIAKAVENRLREKAGRSKIGERAGLGVGAGREMRMLAALGTVRERKRKAAASLPQRPLSAPPTRQSFTIESSPLRRDPPSSVLLARALGHRKSSSSSAAQGLARQQQNYPAAPPAKPFTLGSGSESGLQTLSTIRGFIARRSGSAMEVVTEAQDDDDDDIPLGLGLVFEGSKKSHGTPRQDIIPEEIVKAPPVPPKTPVVDVVVPSPGRSLPALPSSAPPTQTHFRRKSTPSLPLPISLPLPPPPTQFAFPSKPSMARLSDAPSLPQRPPPAARAPATHRRHSTVGITSLPLSPSGIAPSGSRAAPVPREIYNRPSAGSAGRPAATREPQGHWSTPPPPPSVPESSKVNTAPTGRSRPTFKMPAVSSLWRAPAEGTQGARGWGEDPLGALGRVPGRVAFV